MEINWQMWSAIGTVSSSFVALIALLISLRINRIEKIKSSPNLSLYFIKPSKQKSNHIYTN